MMFDGVGFRRFLKTGETVSQDARLWHFRDSLAEHDKRYHGGMFEGGRCLFRQRSDEPDFLGAIYPASTHREAGRPETHQEEYKAVVAKYKDTPMWMKAPNGKPTNLTERQWVQVRTPSFKKWFGDWERAYYTKGWFDIEPGDRLLAMRPIDVSSFEKAVDKEHIKRCFESFGTVRNIKDGRAVRFPENSAGRFVFVKNYVPSFKRLFETSIRAWSENETRFEGHKEHSNILRYHHYLNKFHTKDGEYLVRFTVREGVADAAEGANLVHAANVSDAEVYKNEVAQTDILDRSATSSAGHRPHVDYKIANFLKGVNGDLASKVIDENGEPMVVYHGTKARFDVFTGGNENNSSWFAEKIDYAREYAENPANGVVDAWVKHCFLNIRKPFDMRDGENVVDGYAEICRTRHDGGEASDAEIAKIAKLLGTTADDIRSRFDNRQIWEITQSREFAEHLRSLGYDGIKFMECGDPTWATFDSNQVKSATDNSGAFSPDAVSTLDAAVSSEKAAEKYLLMVENEALAEHRTWPIVA